MSTNSHYLYSNLVGSTVVPNAPVKVLNQKDVPYAKSAQAFDNGLLNPSQDDKTLLGRGYYTIATAYGTDPVNIYKTRGCAM